MSSGGPRRILLIEADAAVAARLCGWLEGVLGRNTLCESVPDLTRAHGKLDATRPEVILLSLDLPEARGTAALAALGPWRERAAIVTLGLAPGAGEAAPGAGEVAPGAGNVAPGAGNVAPGAGNVAPGAGNVAPGAGNVAPLLPGAQDHVHADRVSREDLRIRVHHAAERHRAQRALRVQVDLLHGVLTALPEAVLVVTHDGTVRICNAAARALLDFASGPEAALGPLRAAPDLLERAAQGERIDALPIVCGGPTPESRRHFVATLRPILSGDPQAAGLVILRDVTPHAEVDARMVALNDDLARSLDDRIEALRVAEEANRLKLKFLEAVSHELRTPLTPILGFTRLLMRRPSQPLAPDDQETLELIDENANRLLQVVDSLLDFQALQQQALVLDLAPTAIPSLLEEVAEQVRGRLGPVPVEVTVEIEPGTPEIVMCDGRRMSQILQRLTQNAAAHTLRGEIRLVAGHGDGRLRVAVRDTGPGIAPEQQARIFLAFYQVEPGTGPAHGVGLGLAYAQLLANAMGGSIQVRSELGAGAQFTVEVPVAPVAPVAPIGPPA